MKNVIILGNWKANKSIDEAKKWIDEFTPLVTSLPRHVSLILCPAFHHLELFITIKTIFALGIQDISPYPSGAYTGEISAQMVAGKIQYAILGHSERRKYFRETDEIIAQKVKETHRASIKPIVCVSEMNQASRLKELVPDFEDFGTILYEPLFAVGSGQADSPEKANEIAKEIRVILNNVPVLYGGSVAPDNVSTFILQEHLSGVGVGGASLDPMKFANLIKNACNPR